MEFCANSAGLWGILGYVVWILRIVIPLILIVLGMIDMGKAVIEDDEKSIGNAVGRLVRRFIAALLVFFIPIIIAAIFNAVLPKHKIDLNGTNYTENDTNICVQCLLNRNNTPTGLCESPY